MRKKYVTLSNFLRNYYRLSNPALKGMTHQDLKHLMPYLITYSSDDIQKGYAITVKDKCPGKENAVLGDYESPLEEVTVKDIDLRHVIVVADKTGSLLFYQKPSENVIEEQDISVTVHDSKPKIVSKLNIDLFTVQDLKHYLIEGEIIIDRCVKKQLIQLKLIQPDSVRRSKIKYKQARRTLVDGEYVIK